MFRVNLPGCTLHGPYGGSHHETTHERSLIRCVRFFCCQDLGTLWALPKLKKIVSPQQVGWEGRSEANVQKIDFLKQTSPMGMPQKVTNVPRKRRKEVGRWEGGFLFLNGSPF